MRRVLAEPIEVFRLELERAEVSCRRTTLLDGDTLETLLEADEVRALVARQLPTH